MILSLRVAKAQALPTEIASLTIGDQLGIGHGPGQHAAYIKSWVQFRKEDPKEILWASRDADKIRGCVLGLERELGPTNIEKPPQIQRPAAQPADQPVAQKAFAEARRALNRLPASDRER